MGTRKLEATRELQRIAALPYNHYFHEEVVRIRRRYGIPKHAKGLRPLRPELAKALRRWLKYLPPEEALKYELGERGLTDADLARFWFYVLYSEHYKKRAWALFAPDKETREVLGAGKHIYDTEIPLEKEVLTLLQRFGLPEAIFDRVLQYVLTLDKGWLDPLEFEPAVYFNIDATKGFPLLTITVARLGLWISDKEWARIWKDRVKPHLASLRRRFKAQLGTTEPSKKRMTLKAYSEQMRRWSEWYQLSEIQGLGPTKALEEWERKHPDQCGKYDLSTVTHAIEEFREIITPKGY